MTRRNSVLAALLLLAVVVAVRDLVPFAADVPAPAPLAAPTAESPAAPDVAPSPPTPVRPPRERLGVDADADAAPRPRLRVRVVRVDGLPAAGAKVTVSLPRSDIDGPHSAGKTADKDGRVSFLPPLGTMCVYAWAGDEVGGAVVSGNGMTDVERTVRLEPAVPLRGYVVDGSGRPVAGALVSASVGQHLEADQPWSSRTQSADDGSYALPPVPASAIAASATGLVLTATATGFPPHTLRITSETRLSESIVLTLLPLATLRGRLVKPTGEPVADNSVRVSSRTVSSDAEGRFAVTIPRDGTDVFVCPPWDWRPDVAQRGWGCARSLGRVRGDSGDVDLGDIVLTAGARVAGVVVDAAGRPIERAGVSLFHTSEQIAVAMTDAEGRFAFLHVGDDPHRLSVSKSVAGEPSHDSRTAVLDAVRGGDIDIRIAVTGARSAVLRFVDAATREPVVVSSMSISILEPGDEEEGTYSASGRRTDRWRFEPDRAGRFVMTVILPGYEPSAPVPVDLLEDLETGVDILLRKKPE